MPDPYGKPLHFGPEPNHASNGAEAVHAQILEATVGKTIQAVYLGDDTTDPEATGEYLAFKFTDGSLLALQVGKGNSFVASQGDEARELSPRLDPSH